MWAAGFVDGEGCIQVSRGLFKREGWGPYHHMKLTVTQRVRPPLERLQDLFGGSLSKARTRNLYMWTVTTAQAAVVLAELLPFLTCKAEQARIALAFQARRKKGGHARADGALDEADRLTLARLKRQDDPGRDAVAA